jgi:hypothetical protein
MNRLPFRMTLIAVLIPFALAIAGVAIQLAWLPSLPATIATHWTFDGSADAFGPAWSMPVLLAVVGVVLPTLCAVLLALGGKTGPTFWQKFIAVTSLFVAALLSFVVTSSVGIQVSRPVDAPSPDIAGFLAIGTAAGLVLAVVGWFVLPRAVNGRSVQDAPAAPVTVGPGERVAWVGRARYSTTLLMILVVALVLVTALVLYAAVTAGVWWALVVPLIVGVSVLGTASWPVRIDDSGLTVRSAVGWPRFVVTAADVETAAVVQVMPLGEFGGYGLRYAPNGRVGIVTRRGEALDVKRRNGRSLVVTVDDAGTAAGLLTTLSARVAKG